MFKGMPIEGYCKSSLDIDCTPVDYEVCGCDGQRYASACEAWSQGGVDLALEGGCGPAPAGTIECGATFCPIGERYCHQVLDGEGELVAAYCNVPATEACMTDVTCACILAETGADDSGTGGAGTGGSGTGGSGTGGTGYQGPLHPGCTCDETSGGPILTCQ